MKTERVLKLTIERYYLPSEVPWDYADLLEAHGRYDRSLNPSDSNKKWLDEHLELVGSYDKDSIYEGTMQPKEFLDFSEGEPEDTPDFKIEVVEFTTDDEGEVTERVICEVKDQWSEFIEAEDDVLTAQAVKVFTETTGRPPNLRETLMLQEAAASVALDNGEVGTFTIGDADVKDLPQ